MVLVAGIAVHVMPCHDCGIIETLVYSLSRCFITMHVKQFFACMFYNAVFFLYLYLYGLWPEIKSYYYYYYYYNAIFSDRAIFTFPTVAVCQPR